MKKEKLYEIIGGIDENYICEARKSEKKSITRTWIRRSAMVACLCLVITAAVVLPKIISGFGFAAEDPKYGNTVSYAGWTDDGAVYEGALNKELLQREEDTHLPIFKMDTLEDLERFKSEYGSVFAMDQGYDGSLSFNVALAKAQWDRESFFKEHSLLLIYVPANSGSLRFGVKEVIVTEDSICICVEQKNDPEVVTDDMVGWFVLMEVEKEETQKYTTFDAVFESK